MRIKDSLSIRVLSHNIRYATGSPFKGEELWTVRKSRLCNELVFNTKLCPESIIGLQEVLHGQLLDIILALRQRSSESWEFVGVGRDDGKTAGEYSPVFFRSDVWQLITWKPVWLSETPEKPSKGWDAASVRILTLALLQHRATGHRIIASNTHLDDQGSKSRYESAKLILSSLDEFSTRNQGVPDSLPIVLTGDFNSEPNQEAYQVMNAQESLVRDTSDLIAPEYRYGHTKTFTGFGHDELTRIDFVFVGPKPMIRSLHGEVSSTSSSGMLWQTQNFGVLENVFDDGVYCSDHRAVVADLLLNNSST